MGSVMFKPQLSFNASLFEENEADRWKFLDEMPPGSGDLVGPLLRSPLPVVILTSCYILFVCFLGPFLMRNRQPFQLKSVIRLYNLIMVFLAGYLFVRLYDSVGSLESFVDCSKSFNLSDDSGSKIYRMANFILTVRLSEYLDTIFFTLRKKQNQVTFLHVFHHAFVPIYAFWILRTAPVRFNVYIILINSFIHVLMYFYYFLATFQQSRASDASGAKKAQPKRGLVMGIVTKLLMFKRYMTQLQILQFVTLGVYAIYVALQPNQCNVPWTYIIANFLLAFGFLSLFLHFYFNVYKVAVAANARPKKN